MSFFFISVHQYSDNQSLVLHGVHTITGKRFSFFIKDFFPFMGVLNTDENLRKIIELEESGVVIKKEFYNEENEKYQDYFGKYVIKIYLNKTKDFPLIRKKFSGTYQDDVRYTQVFKTEMNIHVGFIVIDFNKIMMRKKMCLPRQKPYNKNGDYTRYRLLSKNNLVGF